MFDLVNIGNAAELTPGSIKEVEHRGNEYLVANVAGKLIAMEAHCPHRGARLANGRLMEGTVTCPWHGSVFDLADGSPKEWVPKANILLRNVSMALKRNLKTYEVRVVGGDLYLMLPMD